MSLVKLKILHGSNQLNILEFGGKWLLAKVLGRIPMSSISKLGITDFSKQNQMEQ
jgi:hypothetical protein